MTSTVARWLAIWPLDEDGLAAIHSRITLGKEFFEIGYGLGVPDSVSE